MKLGKLHILEWLTRKTEKMWKSKKNVETREFRKTRRLEREQQWKLVSKKWLKRLEKCEKTGKIRRRIEKNKHMKA